MVRQKSSRSIFGILIFLFVAGSLGFAVFFLSQKKGNSLDIRSRASVANGTAKIELRTGTVTHFVGDVFPIDVYLNSDTVSADTAQNRKAISSLSFQLQYPFSGVSPELEIIDDDTTKPGIQIQSHVAGLQSEMSNSVNVVSTNPATDGVRVISNGKVDIQFAAMTTNVSGYVTPGFQKVATIHVRANRAPTGAILISHMSTSSIVTDKVTGLDRLVGIDPISLTVTSDTQAPTISIHAGPAQDATVSANPVSFSWSGVDLPTRNVDTTIAPLTYKYQFIYNAVPEAESAYSSTTSLTRELKQGSYSFKVWAKDAAGNVSVPVIRSFRTDIRPVITALSRNSGTAGVQVDITGTNFGSAKGTNGKVLFGTTVATVVSWSQTSISVTSPATGGFVNVVADNLLTSSNTTHAFASTTMMKLVFLMEGVTTAPAEVNDRNKTKVDVSVSGHGHSIVASQVTATWSVPDSAYVVLIDPTIHSTNLVQTGANPNTFVTGTAYTIKIKERSRLQKAFTAVPLTKGIYNIVLKKTVADALKTGDINGDNTLTNEDFGICMGKITVASLTGIPVVYTDADMVKCDLNADGVLTIGEDITYLLKNYRALSNPGE